MNKFFMFLISIYLRRVLYKRVPYTKRMMKIMEELVVTRENCVVNKVNYQRDYFMFKNIVTRSHGNRILAIVGMFHMKNIDKFLGLYKEGYSKFYPEMLPQEGQEDISEEELNRREEALQAKVLDYVDFNKGKVYCDHSHHREPVKEEA